jgi:fermentation-respiration switch protein FrsA (DUF1100 family)
VVVAVLLAAVYYAAARVTLCRTPVLFTSGCADGEIFRRGLLAPQAELLDKPFSPDAVVRAVREGLAPHRV